MIALLAWCCCLHLLVFLDLTRCKIFGNSVGTLVLPCTLTTKPPAAILQGLEINPDRPHAKLPYRGAWLWIGPEMIHL